MTDQIVSAAAQELDDETSFIFPNYFHSYSERDEQGNTELHRVSSREECEALMETMSSWLTVEDILTLLKTPNNDGKTPVDVAIAAGLDTVDQPTFSNLLANCHVTLYKPLEGEQPLPDELRELRDNTGERFFTNESLFTPTDTSQFGDTKEIV